MNDNIELLPCPFCGSAEVGDEHVQTYSVDSSYDTFGCRTCGAVFVDGGHREWNRRAPKPEAQGVGVDVRARYFLASGLDEYGHHSEAQNVRDGEDLESYRHELFAIKAALATPASHDAQQPEAAGALAGEGSMREALVHAEGRLSVYSKANPNDTELSCMILPMVRRALSAAPVAAQQPAVVGDGDAEGRVALALYLRDGGSKGIWDANLVIRSAYRDEAKTALAALTPAATPGDGGSQ